MNFCLIHFDITEFCGRDCLVVHFHGFCDPYSVVSSLLHSESFHMLLMHLCVVEKLLCDVCNFFGIRILKIHVLE
jgi:hypothetical protein